MFVINSAHIQKCRSKAYLCDAEQSKYQDIKVI